MAVTRPRNFKITRNATLMTFASAADGKQVLAVDTNDIHSACRTDVLVYGLKQLISDSAANAGDKVAAMKERYASIVDGTFKLGDRVPGGLVMQDTFNAARTVGWMKKLDDAAAKDAWKKLTDAMRARIMAMPEVLELLAAAHPNADDELDSMFE